EDVQRMQFCSRNIGRVRPSLPPAIMVPRIRSPGADPGRRQVCGGARVREPRDIERVYSVADMVAKLRRLADALESGRPFRIHGGGGRIRVPARGEFSVEHGREEGTEEVEFQLKWAVEGVDDETEDEPVV